MIAKYNRRFANIRDYMACHDAYNEKFLMFAQVSGTKKYLKLVREKGTLIPQDVLDVFSEKEAALGQGDKELEVGDIPEPDLALSPLILPSQFLNKAL